MKVMKIICLHCRKVTQDIPHVFRKNPMVVVEVVYGFCPEVSDEMKKELLHRLRKKVADKNDKKGGRHGNDRDRL
mgnify:CR=1 FL=1